MFFFIHLYLNSFATHKGSFRGNFVCRCFTGAAKKRSVFLFDMRDIFGIQKKDCSTLKLRFFFTVSFCRCFFCLFVCFLIFKDTACMSPSPQLSIQALQITDPLMEQRIPSSYGYLRCLLSQKGLIHQSCSSDTHITPRYIQMELSGNSHVITSWCLLCPAISGQ